MEWFVKPTIHNKSEHEKKIKPNSTMDKIGGDFMVSDD